MLLTKSLMCIKSKILFGNMLLKGLWRRRENQVQFVLIFHLLSQTRPMTRYDQMQFLFGFPKVFNYPSKHCSHYIRWEIVDNFYTMWYWLPPKRLLWLQVFLYIYKWSDYNWQPKLDFNSLLCNGRGKRVPISLTLECLIDGGTTTNIKTMILVFFIMYGGLNDGWTVECVMCLEFNGISTFEGIRSRIIVLMRIQKHLTSLASILWCIEWTLHYKNLTFISMISKLLHLF